FRVIAPSRAGGSLSRKSHAARAYSSRSNSRTPPARRIPSSRFRVRRRCRHVPGLHRAGGGGRGTRHPGAPGVLGHNVLVRASVLGNNAWRPGASAVALPRDVGGRRASEVVLARARVPTLFVVGGGLYGSLAAAYARSRGIEAVVFDPGLPGAASHAAAGLFRKEWAGKRFLGHFCQAVPVLERLYGIRQVSLKRDDGMKETLLFVPPWAVMETAPRRERVTSVGDGWLEAGGRRYEGWVYVAAGV